MKWKIRRGDGERYTRFIAAFCAALMVLTAGLLTVFSSMVRAEDYMVIVEWDSSTSSAVYYADDGNNTPCYVVSVDGWDVISAVSGEEHTYTSEGYDGGNVYYLTESGGTVTLQAEGYMMVTYISANLQDVPVQEYSFGNNVTTLQLEITPENIDTYLNYINIDITCYAAQDAPDANGVARASDDEIAGEMIGSSNYYFYQYNGGEYPGFFEQLPILSFVDSEGTELTDVSLDNQGNIYTYEYDGEIRYLAPGSLKTVGYTISEIEYQNEEGNSVGTVSVSPSSDTVEITETTLFETYTNSRIWYLEFVLEKGYALSFDPGTGTGTMPTVTIASDGSYTLPDCSFTPPEGMSFSHWELVSINGMPLDVTQQYQPGDPLAPDLLVEENDTLEFQAAWESLPSLPIYFYSGLDDGQVMETRAPATLYILPDCTFTPPAGMQFAAWQLLTTSSDFPVEYPAGAEVDLGTFIADVVEFEAVWKETPEEPDEPDYPSVPDGSGGSSGGATEEIRVDNQLNLPGNSSDTILWPLDTTEKNGTSTTTIRDEELQALIDLAQKHEADAENLDGDGFKEGIILIEDLKATSKNNTYILNITEKQFDILVAEDWDRLTVATPAGNFGLYGSALEELENRTDKGDVSFQLDRLTHEGRPGLDATLLVDGKAVTGFEEPYGIQLMVPYTPASGEDVNAVAVDYLPDNGEPVPVTECYYDENKEGVVLHSSHLSKFGVVYRPATFTDVTASHWANPYVTFLTARGILTVSDGSAFRPDDAVTRGETLELFARALSAAKLPANPVQVYSDIPTSSSVAKAASWAYYNNLSGSIANGSSYRPNESITREDMAALLGDISTGVGLRLRSKGLDTGYNDMNEIAGYAQNSVKRLRAAGILEMPSSYRFYPDSTLTRGELAQILSLLLSNI